MTKDTEDKMTAQDGAAVNAEAVAEKTGLTPMTVNAQYVRDLSIENPNAPLSLARNDGQPTVSMHVDVQARKLEGEMFNEDTYEVVLNIRSEAKQGEMTSFIAELSYGAVITLGEIDQKYINPVLLIEGPRLLFPFARAIIAEATRDAGFPPLMMNPIDFAELYRRQLEEYRKQQKAADGADKADKEGATVN